ncbi:MAG: hypothetical protein LBQ50_05070 [Planctomycetaceae bacterium]|jgi:hypothetical protein|nr:hypothetical protein [Planctomycetaceae bacterium]
MVNQFFSNINTIINEKCWQVSNSILGTIRLKFGGAITSNLGRAGFCYAGQYDVLIWCQWRLDDGNVSLCSWDNAHEVIMNIVSCLVGDTLTSIEIISPLGDAVFTFSSGKILRIFCNEIQDSDNSLNWSFGLMDDEYYIGLNGKLKKGKRLGIVPSPVVVPPTTADYEAENPKIFTNSPPSFKAFDQHVIEEVKEQFKNLIGKPCHTVNNIDGWILQLDFGGFLKRTSTEKEFTETRKQFCYGGELDVLIWCVWRLKDFNGAVCSSESTPEQQKEGTKRLIGETVVAADFFPPAWDATIQFSSDLTLQIFCNYTHFSEIETNWFFRNGWKLFCFNRCDDIERAKIDWDIQKSVSLSETFEEK